MLVNSLASLTFVGTDCPCPFRDPLTFVLLNFSPHSLSGSVCHRPPSYPTFTLMYQTPFCIYPLIFVRHKAAGVKACTSHTHTLNIYEWIMRNFPNRYFAQETLCSNFQQVWLCRKNNNLHVRYNHHSTDDDTESLGFEEKILSVFILNGASGYILHQICFSRNLSPNTERLHLETSITSKPQTATVCAITKTGLVTGRWHTLTV